MKRIALVDDDLDNYHTNVFLEILRGPLKDRGYQATGCHALKEESGRAWAHTHDVPYLSTPADLNSSADFYMILAPLTSATHLPLCRKVIPFGKPVWVDKTFAPDLASAEEIFRLADAHRVPVDTASALRYTAIQEHVASIGRDTVRHITAWGGGTKLEEYLIHPVEIAVSCLGAQARRVMCRGTGAERQLLIDFSRDRTATVNLHLNTSTPFAASVTTREATTYIEVDTERLFVDALAAVLDFFDRRAPTIDRQETVAIRRIMDAALKTGSTGKWVDLQ